MDRFNRKYCVHIMNVHSRKQWQDGRAHFKGIYSYFHLLLRVSRLTGDHTIIRIPWKCGLTVLQPLLKEESR